MITVQALTLLLAPIAPMEAHRVPVPLMTNGGAVETAASAPRLAARAERAGRASSRAVREPDPRAYLGAIQVYPFREGAVYRLITAPGHVSDIALQPGETLISVAAGDTARWNVGDTTSGAGDTLRTHVMIKPQVADLQTNIVITTDRRVYRLALESHAGAAMIAVRWSYPNEGLVVLRGASGPEQPAVAGAIDPTDLDFGYTVHGDDPPWRPVRAFDDGRQVFIEFPARFGTGAAPPLFVVGPEGKPHLVNYRVRGNHYIVDRLFEVAELRYGAKTQEIVRICSSAAAPDACTGRGQ